VAEFATVTEGIAPGPGEIAVFELQGERIAVANVEGRLYAFDDLCAHRQCSLGEGGLEGTVVTCPCHGSRFDVATGERLRGPAVRPLRRHAVRVENDALRVEI
jgi:3-phenylpropionate/trans-cinnamate dioxygenase ferredoxin component